MRVLHVLDFSLPQIQSGYSIRSKYIVDCQKDLGLEPAVATRDTIPVRDPVRPVLCEEEQHGVRYFREPALAIEQDTLARLRETPGFDRDYSGGMSRRFRKLIARAVRAHRPDVIHAASPDVIGLWASDVAREFGLPLVYEVRGLWHETSVAMGRIEPGSAAYEKMSATFVEALKRADAIVTLSETVKAEIGRSGIPLERVHLVPNGVDVDRFSPRERPGDLAQELGIAPEEAVIGYVGSLRPFEGLELTLRALSKLRDRGLPVRGVFAGAGESLDDLEEVAATLDLGDIVHFVGRVTHDRAPDYVALIDIYTMPRVRSRVTELVTPLKPYEALAAGKAVVVSDVAALREIVKDGETGMVCRADDADDLGDKCERLVRNPGLRKDLGQKGRAWVVAERSWRDLAGRYPEIYMMAGVEPDQIALRLQAGHTRRTAALLAVDDAIPSLEAAVGPLAEDDRIDLTRISPELGRGRVRETITQTSPDSLVVPSYPFDPWLPAEQVSELVEVAREANPDVDVVCLIHDETCVRGDDDRVHYESVCPVLYSLFDAILMTTGSDNPVDRFPWVSDIVVPVIRVDVDAVGDFLVGL